MREEVVQSFQQRGMDQQMEIVGLNYVERAQFRGGKVVEANKTDIGIKMQTKAFFGKMKDFSTPIHKQGKKMV